MSNLNLYPIYNDGILTVVLEVYGLIDQDTGLPELVEKCYFASFDAARYYILLNNLK